MKKYIAPEIEKIEYDLIDCLETSGEQGPISNESEKTDTIFDGLV